MSADGAGGVARAELTYVGHATVAMWIDQVHVLTDPVLEPRLKHLRRISAMPEGFDPASVDLVLVSHQHHDHLHVPSLKRLRFDVHLVVPRGAGSRLTKLGFTHVTEVEVDDVVTHGPLIVTAVPAVHDDRRHPGVPRVDPIGFTIASGTWSVYFPGDTAVFAEMADIDPDLSLIPVWGWGPTLGGGHLDPEGAAEALELLGSPMAVPIHWGTLWPYHVTPNDRLVLPPLELEEAVRRRGLAVEILRVEPGGRLEIPR